jgi:hypothetical protein
MPISEVAAFIRSLVTMSVLGLGRVKTQRRANCGEKYFFGSSLWEREEHTELRRRRHLRSRFSARREISRFHTARVKNRRYGASALGPFIPGWRTAALSQFCASGACAMSAVNVS